MWDNAKLVTLMSDRAPVGEPRNVAPSASHESSTTCKPVALRDRSDPVPVGRVPDQVRKQDRLRVRADRRLDELDIRVVGVGFDIHEDRHETGAHHWRDVGGERQRGGDDLAPRRKTEQLDREVQRGRTRVAHHTALLGEQLGDRRLELANVAPDPECRRAAAKHTEHGFDLVLVVHAAGVLDPSHTVILSLTGS